MNFVDELRKLKDAGMTFSDCVAIFGSDDSNPYVDAARKHFHREGEVEFDDTTVVSESEDAGAYVMAWIWVDDIKMDLDDAAQPLAVEDEADLTRFRNFYRCPDCGYEWEDQWDCMVDDDCPTCGSRHISPYRSEDTDGEEVNECECCGGTGKIRDTEFVDGDEHACMTCNGTGR